MVVMLAARVCCVVLGALTACTTVPSASVGSPSVPNTPSGGAATSDHRRLEREILDELNAARTNPPAYANRVGDLLMYFDGMLLKRPGTVAIRTSEGAAAVREAVAALRAQPAVGALSSSAALSEAARDLAVDQGRTGSVGHTASDGGTIEIRISRHGRWGVSISENVAYGRFSTGRDVVVDLIVDDGVRDRGHRRNIYEATARVVGIACGPHPRFGSMCVIDQAGSYIAR
jgi:uncharacterized protein YkwD